MSSNENLLCSALFLADWEILQSKDLERDQSVGKNRLWQSTAKLCFPFCVKIKVSETQQANMTRPDPDEREEEPVL